MPPLTKTCPKMVPYHKGCILFFKDVFLKKKFFGAGAKLLFQRARWMERVMVPITVPQFQFSLVNLVPSRAERPTEKAPPLGGAKFRSRIALATCGRGTSAERQFSP